MLTPPVRTIETQHTPMFKTHTRFEICNLSCNSLACRLVLGFSTYLIIGAIVLKFHFGMTGRVIIPNRDFWNELPYLIQVSDTVLECLCGDVIILQNLS